MIKIPCLLVGSLLFLNSVIRDSFVMAFSLLMRLVLSYFSKSSMTAAPLLKKTHISFSFGFRLPYTFFNSVFDKL